MRHRIILDFWGKKKKKKRGIFGHFWGPLARPPDLPNDWNDGILKFSLAAFAEVPYPLFFFACGAIFLFCSAKKGLLSGCVVVNQHFYTVPYFFFACGAIYFFPTRLVGRKVQDQAP